MVVSGLLLVRLIQQNVMRLFSSLYGFIRKMVPANLKIRLLNPKVVYTLENHESDLYFGNSSLLERSLLRRNHDSVDIGPTQPIPHVVAHRLPKLVTAFLVGHRLPHSIPPAY